MFLQASEKEEKMKKRKRKKQRKKKKKIVTAGSGWEYHVFKRRAGVSRRSGGSALLITVSSKYGM